MLKESKPDMAILRELLLELAKNQSSLQTPDDLRNVINVVERMMEATGDAFGKLREILESRQWSEHTQRPTPNDSPDSNALANSIYDIADRMKNRMETTYKRLQLMNQDLTEISKALNYFLPVYEYGTQIFEDQEEIEAILKDAVKELYSNLEGTIS